MVRQRDGIAFELRSGDAGDRGRSRCNEFGKRIRFTHPQSNGQRPGARGWAVPAGLFPGALRSELDGLRVRVKLLLFLWLARPTNGARWILDCELGTYGFAEGAVFGCAVLPL